MAIKLYRPTTPAQRGKTTQDFDQITTRKPLKSLTRAKKQQAGRNNQGRITVRHRGGGVKRHYRLLTHNLPKDLKLEVMEIEYDPNRSARIARVKDQNGVYYYVIADKNMVKGSTFTTGDESAGHNRWLLWQITMEHIASRPFLGYGCEGLSETLMDLTGRANPHNEILTYAAYFGIPAALLYAAGVLITVINGIRSGEHASMTAAFAAAAYFISSMFGVSMFYTTPFLFVLLGLSHRPEAKPDAL